MDYYFRKTRKRKDKDETAKIEKKMHAKRDRERAKRQKRKEMKGIPQVEVYAHDGNNNFTKINIRERYLF